MMQQLMRNLRPLGNTTRRELVSLRDTTRTRVSVPPGVGYATLRKLLPPLLAVAFFAGACASVDSVRKQRGASRGKVDVAAYYGARHDIPPDQWKWKESAPYQIAGVTYYPLAKAEGYEEKGIASWYGPDFDAKPTANGETYNQDSMTAAHRTLPFNTLVLVENLDNGRSVVVRVNDRGPYAKDRIIDLSKRAATEIAMVGTGTARVRLSVKYAVKKDEAAFVDASRSGSDTASGPLGDDGNDPGRGFLPLGKKKRATDDAPAADASAEPKKHRSYSGKMMHD